MKKLDFEQILKDNTKEYNGKFCFLIRQAPSLYRLINKIVEEADLKKEIKSKLFCAIGYFICPIDLYPESEHGPIGYIDDLILLISILREIRYEYGEGFLFNFWKEDDEELTKILDQEFEDAIKEYPDLHQELIDLIGF